jgi:carboxymethylenebutenolidase
MTDAIVTASIRITGADGDEIEAYSASPVATDNRRGGVVLIHHMPGFDRWSKEVVRRFAVDGYDVLAPNLYWREAPDADPDDAAAIARANGGVPDDRLVGDVRGALEHLRALSTSNGKVGVIGHCSGGRQSVLAGCSLPFDAAVDCYGAFVVGTPPEGFPLQVSGLEDELPNLSCPLLGLFGNDDSYPSPEQVDTLSKLLDEAIKEYEFLRYDGAGHGFFAADRPSYRPEAAVDGYEHIGAFFARNLG